MISGSVGTNNEATRKPLNMIWANEAGVSVYIYEGEHDRRIIEIHSVVNDYETVLATATIEKHNRNRLAEAIEYLDLAEAVCMGMTRDGEQYKP